MEIHKLLAPYDNPACTCVLLEVESTQNLVHHFQEIHVMRFMNSKECMLLNMTLMNFWAMAVKHQISVSEKSNSHLEAWVKANITSGLY